MHLDTQALEVAVVEQGVLPLMLLEVLVLSLTLLVVLLPTRVAEAEAVHLPQESAVRVVAATALPTEVA